MTPRYRERERKLCYSIASNDSDIKAFGPGMSKHTPKLGITLGSKC